MPDFLGAHRLVGLPSDEPPYSAKALRRLRHLQDCVEQGVLLTESGGVQSLLDGERDTMKTEIHELRHEMRQAEPWLYQFDGTHRAWAEAGRPADPDAKCEGENCRLRTRL